MFRSALGVLVVCDDLAWGGGDLGFARMIGRTFIGEVSGTLEWAQNFL